MDDLRYELHSLPGELREKYSPSCPVLRRCSPRSHPKTRSFRIPLFFNLPLVGLERMKLLKKVMSLPCFLSTGLVGSDGESEVVESLLARWGSVWAW